MKRFEDAYRDKDNILAVIRGSAINNDGAGTSFGTPNEKAQEMVYRSALKHAKIMAADVSYIETHGTGTMVGKFHSQIPKTFQGNEKCSYMYMVHNS